MYVIIAPIQIKDGFKEQYIDAMVKNANSALKGEPGCLRFEVIQDADDANRIWLYEVYRDEAAFQAHTQSPHLIKFRDASANWREQGRLQGAGSGASNIFPSDNDWQ